MSDVLDRLTDALTDRYRIERELGAGGMATVYLADDLKHNRQVAIKVLRPELAAVVGRERFFSEIETTAQLQHPNILPLFDSGEADGLLFYAMPYVEGETLSDWLAREHQLPVDTAIDIARKLASALDYAHQRGVVHRDVKPANVLISSGEPLIADFGIALALSHAGDGRITETGLSLGTPHYMSPEQASGDRSLDPRSDVYGLGCVLYEMLAGEPPFPGPSAQAVLARILTSAPARVSTRRPTVPAHVDAALARALEKLPADRFATAGDFRKALGDAAFRHTTVETPAVVLPTAAPRRRSGPLVPALAAACVVLAGAAVAGWLRSAPTPPVQRFRIQMDVGDFNGLDFAISPDGSRIVYIGADRQLYQRPLESLEGQPIPGAQPARGVFFSPDGASVGFDLGQGDDRIHTVPLSGGSPIPVGDPLAGVDPVGEWGDDGYIYYFEDVPEERLVRVAEQGGTPQPIEFEGNIFVVEKIPGVDDRLLVSGTWGAGRGMGMLDLETGQVEPVAGLEGAVNGLYAGGYLFWVTLPGGILAAAGFDPERAELTTNPVTIAEGVAPNNHSVSETGTLVYRGGTAAQVTGETVGWLSRSGDTEVVDAGLAAGAGDFDGVRLSADGRYMAVEVQRGGDQSAEETHRILIYDLEQGTSYQLSFEGRFNTVPRWMPGGRVAYISDQGGSDGVWAQPFDRSGQEEPLFEFDGIVEGFDVGPDPAAPMVVDLIPANADGEMSQGLYLVDLQTGEIVRPFVATRFVEWGPAISPDGRWLAYTSDESGRDEVYVRAFPEGGRPYPISVEGAVAPAWSPSGDELIYRTQAGISSVELEIGDGVSVSSRATLLSGAGSFELIGDAGASYDIGSDGRLLAVFERSAQSGVGADADMPVIVTNVFEELRRRLGGGER